MAKLGSKKKPVVCCVQTFERAAEIIELCEEHGWRYIVGIEPDQPEDIRDLARLLGRSLSPASLPQEPGRNHPCPCGSGSKYKHCCME